MTTEIEVKEIEQILLNSNETTITQVICCQKECTNYYAYAFVSQDNTTQLCRLHVVVIDSANGDIESFRSQEIVNSNFVTELECCSGPGDYFAFGAISLQTGPPTNSLAIVTVNSSNGNIGVLNKQDIPDSTFAAPLVCCKGAGNYFAFGALSSQNGPSGSAISIVTINSASGAIGVLRRQDILDSTGASTLACAIGTSNYFAFGALGNQTGPPSNTLAVVTVNSVNGTIGTLNKQDIPDSSGVGNIVSCSGPGNYVAFGATTSQNPSGNALSIVTLNSASGVVGSLNKQDIADSNFLVELVCCKGEGKYFAFGVSTQNPSSSSLSIVTVNSTNGNIGSLNKQDIPDSTFPFSLICCGEQKTYFAFGLLSSQNSPPKGAIVLVTVNSNSGSIGTINIQAMPNSIAASSIVCCDGGRGNNFAFGALSELAGPPDFSLSVVTVNGSSGAIGPLITQVIPNSIAVSNLICCSGPGDYFAIALLVNQNVLPTISFSVVVIDSANGDVGTLNNQGIPDSIAFPVSIASPACCRAEGDYFTYGMITLQNGVSASALSVVAINSVNGSIGNLRKQDVSESMLTFNLSCCRGAGDYIAYGVTSVQAGLPTVAISVVTVNSANGKIGLLNKQNIPGSTDASNGNLTCCNICSSSAEECISCKDLVCNKDIAVRVASGEIGARVDYREPNTNLPQPFKIECTPRSGSFFLLGNTTVACLLQRGDFFGFASTTTETDTLAFNYVGIGQQVALEQRCEFDVLVESTPVPPQTTPVIAQPREVISVNGLFDWVVVTSTASVRIVVE